MIVRNYEEPFMVYAEFRAHKHFMLCIPPILMVLGTVGNGLAFAVLTRRAMRRYCSYVYLAFLAITDTLILYVGLFRLWISELTGTDIRDLNDASCKMINIVGYSASDLSVWLIIAVTFERYLVVCKPLKLFDMNNIKRALKVVSAIFFIFLSLHLHFAWTVQVVYFPVGESIVPQCTAGDKYQTLIEEVWPWVDALIYSFIPFVLILVFNTSIIRQILKANRLRREISCTAGIPSQSRLSGQLAGSNESECRGPSLFGPQNRFRAYDSGKLTVMLLTISFAFLVTTLPANIALITVNIWTPKDMHQMSQIRLFRTVTELLMYLNHSSHFYLYCATGRKFRLNLCRLLHLNKYVACGYMEVQVLHSNKAEQPNPKTPGATPRPYQATWRGSRNHMMCHGLGNGNEIGLKHLGPPGTSSSPNNMNNALHTGGYNMHHHFNVQQKAHSS